jgi:hypothetical protein
MISSKDFRSRVSSLLSSSLAIDVLDSRALNIEQEKFPIINVFVTSEKIFHSDDITLTKTFVMQIDCLVQGSNDAGKSVADSLDDLRYEIERIIISSNTLRVENLEQVYKIMLSGTPVIKFQALGEKTIGEAVIEFEITCSQEYAEEPVHDFEELGVKYDLVEGNNSVVEAEDLLDFSEN